MLDMHPVRFVLTLLLILVSFYVLVLGGFCLAVRAEGAEPKLDCVHLKGLTICTVR